MFRFIAIGLFLVGIFHFEEKDKFYFPTSFNKLNFRTATIDTIFKLFGRKCVIDTTYHPEPELDHKISITAEVKVRYESSQLVFWLHSRNSIKDSINWNLQLELVEINAGSSFRFGKTPRRIETYKENSFVSMFGQPDKIQKEHLLNKFKYCLQSPKRQCEFWFSDTTKVLKSIMIRPWCY